MTPESITTIVPAPASELPETGTEVTSVDFKPRRKRGPQSKIAQLPGHQRTLINRFLDDDKTYRFPMNLKNWWPGIMRRFTSLPSAEPGPRRKPAISRSKHFICGPLKAISYATVPK